MKERWGLILKMEVSGKNKLSLIGGGKQNRDEREYF